MLYSTKSETEWGKILKDSVGKSLRGILNREEKNEDLDILKDIKVFPCKWIDHNSFVCILFAVPRFQCICEGLVRWECKIGQKYENHYEMFDPWVTGDNYCLKDGQLQHGCLSTFGWVLPSGIPMIAAAFFPLASSKGNSLVAVFILEIKPRDTFIHQRSGYCLASTRRPQTVKPWGFSLETRDVGIMGFRERLILC